MFNSYAAGKKVYGRGSYRPTAGRVNPQGYIKRELAKRNKKRAPHPGVSRLGMDGKSDTRSGLASAALQRASMAKMQSLTGTTAPNPNLPPVGAPAPVTPQSPLTQAPVSTAGQTKINGTGTQGPVATGAGDALPSPTNNNAPAGTPQAPAIPTIKINPNGTLDLPYDSQTSADLLQQKEQANQALLELQAAEQEQAMNFTTQRRDMDLSYEGQRRETLNGAAGRGTAFSSGYGVAVGDNARDYNNMLNDLLAGNNSFKQDTERRRNGIVTNFNDFVRKEALDRAARLAEKAGSLGYGKSGVTPGTKDPGNPKNTPKKTTSTHKKPKPKPKPTRATGKPKPKPKAKPGRNTHKLSPAQIRAAAQKKASSTKKKRL